MDELQTMCTQCKKRPRDKNDLFKGYLCIGCGVTVLEHLYTSGVAKIALQEGKMTLKEYKIRIHQIWSVS